MDKLTLKQTQELYWFLQRKFTKKTPIIILLLAVYVSSINIAFNYGLSMIPVPVYTKPIDNVDDVDTYAKGYNDALDHIALVNLEFTELKHERKTFGELADICRERKGIVKDR